MYVARFDKKGIFWTVTILDKKWSEEMSTHTVEPMASRRFLFHSSGYRWINKEVAKYLFSQHVLEIIDG